MDSHFLCWWIVYQREGMMGLSHERIAMNLSIDPSTVRRTVKLFNDTGRSMTIPV